MVKDDWPFLVWLTRILPKILKLRFSLHMVKMIDCQGMTDQYLS